MNVFENYARYYDLLYKEKDYSAETCFLDRLIKRYSVRAKTLFELGCGSGLNAAHLARMGYAVRGIDISENMLKMADERMKTLDKYVSENIELSIGDVRNVDLGKKFDAAVSLFHVISYQVTNNDLKSVFNVANRHLERGGLFIFDCWYGPAILTIGPSPRVKRMEGDGIAVSRFAEPSMRANENIIDVHYRILIEDLAAQTCETIAETHAMRYLFSPEVDELFSQSGFERLDAREWMTDREPGLDTWGVYFVGRKIKDLPGL